MQGELLVGDAIEAPSQEAGEGGGKCGKVIPPPEQA